MPTTSRSQPALHVWPAKCVDTHLAEFVAACWLPMSLAQPHNNMAHLQTLLEAAQKSVNGHGPYCTSSHHEPVLVCYMLDLCCVPMHQNGW